MYPVCVCVCVSCDHCAYVCVCEQLHQIDRINNIYKGHSFGVCGSGFGFEIKQVRSPSLTNFVLLYCTFLLLLDITCYLPLHFMANTTFLICRQFFVSPCVLERCE